MSSAVCFNLDKFKILSSGNGLNETEILQHVTEFILSLSRKRKGVDSFL